jgi:hypothetical protein
MGYLHFEMVIIPLVRGPLMTVLDNRQFPKHMGPGSCSQGYGAPV